MVVAAESAMCTRNCVLRASNPCNALQRQGKGFVRAKAEGNQGCNGCNGFAGRPARFLLLQQNTAAGAADTARALEAIKVCRSAMCKKNRRAFDLQRNT